MTYAQVSRGGRKTYQHVLVAEAALGKALPVGAVVHHVDDDKRNNRPDNLVICPSQAYHMLVHARARVVDAGGHPDTQKVCKSCRLVKNKDAFSFEASWDGRAAACRECTNVRRRGRPELTPWTPERNAAQQRRRAAACV